MTVVSRIALGLQLVAVTCAMACASPIGDRVGRADPAPAGTAASAAGGPSSPASALGPAPADIRSIDWTATALPGEFCGVGGNLTFTGDEVVSRTFGKVYLRVDPDTAAYGDADGDGADDAAVRVHCDNGGGTAGGQLAFGYVVVRASGGTLQALGSIVPQEQTADGSHVTLLDGLRFGGRSVEVEELFYRPDDATCCPTGYALSTWTYDDGRLVARPPVITTPVPERTARETLDGFLRTWRAGDTAHLSDYVEPDALSQFTEDPGSWAQAELNWSSSCEPAPGQAGTCPVVLVSPSGGGVTYLAHYEPSDRKYTITGFENLGGGA